MIRAIQRMRSSKREQRESKEPIRIWSKPQRSFSLRNKRTKRIQLETPNRKWKIQIIIKVDVMIINRDAGKICFRISKSAWTRVRDDKGWR